MQRLTLSAFSDAGLKDSPTTHIVEVAAGTGRLATFVRDNYRSIQLSVTDLSPYYLDTARKAHEEWARETKCKQHGESKFMQVAAEDLPFENESVDVLYSVYLFHEILPSVRVKAMAEASRVLRKGGFLILTDALQLGDCT